MDKLSISNTCTILVHKESNYQLFQFFGFLDAFSIPMFNEIIVKHIDKEQENLILDLSTVEFLDSAGLGSLVRLKNDFKGNILVIAKGTVAKIIELLGLKEYLSLQATLDAAVHKINPITPEEEAMILTKTSQHPSLSQGRDITGLFLGWQDYQTDLWLPVAKMTWEPDKSQYCFRYTKGMERVIKVSLIEKSSFIDYPDRMYQSHITENESLKFKTRMPLCRTTHVPKHQEWLGLPGDPIDPIAYVSRTGGKRQNDSYDVFPEVNPDADGNYHFHFLPFDLNKMDTDSYRPLLDLPVGSILEVVNDQLSNGRTLFGRLPGYLLTMIRTCRRAVQIEVAQVNPRAAQFQGILCHATVNGQLLTPFDGMEYETCVGA